MNNVSLNQSLNLKRPSPNSPQETNKQRKKRKVEKTAKKSFSDRCFVCNKNPYPIPFKCQCKGVYCIKHKQPEDHNCGHDYKKDFAEVLKKNNPKVVADKVNNRI